MVLQITDLGVDASGKFSTAELKTDDVKILWDQCILEKVEGGGFCAQSVWIGIGMMPQKTCARCFQIIHMDGTVLIN